MGRVYMYNVSAVRVEQVTEHWNQNYYYNYKLYTNKYF
jgi:hypothetical protein